MTFRQKELQEATQDFSKKHMVGKGGFGQVYRGRVRCSDVAIKVLSAVSGN